MKIPEPHPIPQPIPEQVLASESSSSDSELPPLVAAARVEASPPPWVTRNSP